MNTFDGYIRRDGTNSKVLLDGGDAKALSSFIGTLSYNNNKITYTKADGNTSYDLVDLSNYIYNLNVATSDNLGGIRIGFSQSGKNYPVQLDSNNKAYVYVPWEENSHYTTRLYVGDGTAENKVTTNGNTRITVTDNNNVRNYITLIGSGATNISSDNNGKITINSTNTTYDTGNSETLNKGINTEGKLWSAKTLVDYISDILGVDSTAITSLNTLIGQLHDNDTATGILVELAKKLNTPSSSIGSNKQPIYWNGSSFTTIGYTIEKSVPSNAIFTDTKYSFYIGENNNIKEHKNVSNPYFKLFENNTPTSIQIKAGTGISVASDANGNITITNSSPDQNHNTDKTGIKLGTISGTKKTDSTVIINNSSTGLTIAGGTNKFSIGDGTNYIEIPITPSFTVSNKDATIGTSLTTIATIAGTDIKAKIGSYLPLSGGTLTGHLTIKTSAYRDQLTIYRNENSSNSVINFSNKDGFLGAIGFTGIGQTGMPEKPHVVLKDGTLYTLLHSGNTSISNGTITINGTSITPLTSIGSYIPLSGNTTSTPITGTLYFKDVSGIVLNSKDLDVDIWKVYGNSGAWKAQYGFHLKYLGTGSGNNNDLVLYAHNQQSTHKEVYRVHQDGTFIFGATPYVGANTIVHSGNVNQYAITYLSNYLTITTNQTVSGVKTFNGGCWSIAASESNEITTEHFGNSKYYNNANTTLVNNGWSITNAIKFRWYSDYWLIGNIRSGNTDTAGFGIAFRDNTNVRQIDCFRVTKEEAYIKGYIALHTGNSSVSKSGETLTVNIGGTSYSLTNTNTWRGITDSYSGTDSTISLSQKGGNNLYNSLLNGYASSAGNAEYSHKLDIHGYSSQGLSFYQTARSFDSSPEGWAHYIIANHGNGESYYHYTIRLPFWSIPQYRRQVGSTSDVTQWYNFITEENISSQSVNYATYANYLNLVDENEIRFSNKPSSSIDVYFNYVWAGGIADDKIIDYRFMNGNREYAGIIAKSLQCINGNVTATAFYASSDFRLKNILTHPNYSAKQLASLPLVKYTWKDKENDSIHIGSIAQDVERIIPEIVNIDNEGYKSLDYATLGAIGIISLAREIVELKKEIKELKSKLYG